MIEYTVFAVYEDNWQPYCAVVQANDPEQAAEVAQEQVNEYNQSETPLVGAQVAIGTVEVVYSDEPIN